MFSDIFCKLWVPERRVKCQFVCLTPNMREIVDHLEAHRYYFECLRFTTNNWNYIISSVNLLTVSSAILSIIIEWNLCWKVEESSGSTAELASVRINSQHHQECENWNIITIEYRMMDCSVDVLQHSNDEHARLVKFHIHQLINSHFTLFYLRKWIFRSMENKVAVAAHFITRWKNGKLLILFFINKQKCVFQSIRVDQKQQLIIQSISKSLKYSINH